MADDFTPRERAAAQDLAARWRYAADLVFPTDVSMERAEAWLGVARVALRAADGVKKPIAKCEWDVRSGWCAKCGHGIGAGCV